MHNPLNNTPALTGHAISVEVKVLDAEFWSGHDIANYATQGSAAFDLRANIKKPVELKPGETMLIGTGLAFWINQPGYALVILPRSGMGSRGLVLGNGTGLIDSDYQGELLISAYNRLQPKIDADQSTIDVESGKITINPGDRIAQAMIVPVVQMHPQIVTEFSNKTVRADGGFGHSGVA